MTLTFFGHADISSSVHAICEVEGGPIYELELKGEASLVQYQFDRLEVDFGKQVIVKILHIFSIYVIQILVLIYHK